MQCAYVILYHKQWVRNNTSDPHGLRSFLLLPNVSSIGQSESTNPHYWLAAQVNPGSPPPFALGTHDHRSLRCINIPSSGLFVSQIPLQVQLGRQSRQEPISSRAMIGFNSPFKSARTGTKGRPHPGDSILIFTSMIAASGLRDPLDGHKRRR